VITKTGSSGNNRRLRPLVLLDRDGTINVEVDYLSDPAQLQLLPGVSQGLKLLRQAGIPLAIVTNQSGVGRGFFTEETLAKIHDRLEKMLADQNIKVEGIFSCPHHPREKCACRKPLPGMALKAAAALNGDLSRSFVVGDKPCDIELGKNIGARTILVRSGYGRNYNFSSLAKPDMVAENMEEAALWILGQKT